MIPGGLDIRYWFNDESEITLTGDIVDQWNDLSGNGYHIIQTGALRPVVSEDPRKGKRALLFDGARNLDFPASALGLARNVPSMWCAWVAQVDPLESPTSRPRDIISFSTSDGSKSRLWTGFSASGRPEVGGRTSDAHTFGVVGGAATAEFVARLGLADYANNVLKLYGPEGLIAEESDPPWSVNTTTDDTNSDRIVVGRGFSTLGDRYFSGLLAELVGGVTLPTEDEISETLSELQKKWITQTEQEIFAAAFADASGRAPLTTALIRPADAQKCINTLVHYYLQRPQRHEVSTIVRMGELESAYPGQTVRLSSTKWAAALADPRFARVMAGRYDPTKLTQTLTPEAPSDDPDS